MERKAKGAGVRRLGAVPGLRDSPGGWHGAALLTATWLGRDGRDGAASSHPSWSHSDKVLEKRPQKGTKQHPKNAKSNTGNAQEPCPLSKGRRGGDIRWPPLVPPGAAVPTPASVMQSLPFHHYSSPAASPR